MMWLTLCLFKLVFLSTIQAQDCHRVIDQCKQEKGSWTKCYERDITTCKSKGRQFGFHHSRVNVSHEAGGSLINCRVHVPSSALQMSRGNVSDEEVLLIIAEIDGSLFQLVGGRSRSAAPSRRTILNNSVVVVKAGTGRVSNLSQPVRITFQYKAQMGEAACVFWQDADQDDGTGYWSREGCQTEVTGTEVICCCNHLSFFAVLVNPVLSVEKESASTLSYISFSGSALSALFSFLALVVYSILQRGRPEKSVSVHLQLAAALLCLHLSFLLCGLWVLLLPVKDEGWLCRGLGLLLHWSLLATFMWMALEGFHLYLLLVRVFNIYIKKYVLKLSLVAWGLPTVTVAICGTFGVYGRFSLELEDDNNLNSTVQLCWLSSQFPQSLLVSYVTTVALPSLVLLFNTFMVCLVVFKLWGLRKRSRGIGDGGGGWKKMNKENWARMWKDGGTVLGLSCVLGLPWGLSSVTYLSLPGIYLFTVLNALQGIFIFLWSMALICKTRAERSSSSLRDTCSQKLMTTSFNN